jgi:chromosomal replication initiation ATPase DnaA
MTCLDLLKASPEKPPSIEAILGPCRTAELVKWRHFLAYELRKRGLSISQVGSMLNRKRSTIIHAEAAVADRLETDKKYREWHENMLALTQTNQEK